jgi:hypothetical protein
MYKEKSGNPELNLKAFLVSRLNELIQFSGAYIKLSRSAFFDEKSIPFHERYPRSP